MSSGETRPGLGETHTRQPGEPIITLLPPQSAPPHLLELVRVNSERGSLDATTGIGEVSLEIYWGAEKDGHDPNKADIFGALDTTLDPDAADNPAVTQESPYAILPFNSFYTVAVRVPVETVAEDWSDEKVENIVGGIKIFEPTTSLASFRQRFPDVDVSDVEDGDYEIEMIFKQKPTIGIVIRAEDGEPLIRRKKILEQTSDPAPADDIEGDLAALTGDVDLDGALMDLGDIVYEELRYGGISQSGLRPDTALLLVGQRLTISDDEIEEADGQRLRFVEQDSFTPEETPANKRGLLEVIVYREMQLDILGFKFNPPGAKERLYKGLGVVVAPRDRVPAMMDLSRDIPKGIGRSPEPPSQPLQGGQTRYMEPKKVQVSMNRSRNPRPIAAFQIGLVAQPQAA